MEQFQTLLPYKDQHNTFSPLKWNAEPETISVECLSWCTVFWLYQDMEQPRKSKRNNERWDIDRVRYKLDKPMSPKRDMKSVSDILKDVVSDFEQPVQESIVVLRNAWDKLAGKAIAKHSEPGFIKDYALVVFVDHPGWIPELERMKRPLLLKLQSNYREMQIRQLRFELKH